ncbi:ribose-5-phosphate isomerase RpiA [Virgibacillus proomii]|jgi:ribose 5-phosphate isomerase A|uniref:ribose-5-phosphate isomerase RpiA n=1 Tax=Virgibacillus proomii TaxID=84407 RepID=UPI0009851B5F|nr:ribose-5-phosphate isomerase RpiA [Virgibacillus proomii]
MNDVNRDKRAAAKAAVAYVNSGMTIGLGTGSTVNYLLDELAKQIGQGLEVEGIPTSIKTEKLAREKGIPLTDFSETTKVDLAIDGADEVDSQLQLIKGGGGSLVREKIVAAAADQLIIIVDASKRVSKLGAFPLPIEVVPFGWEKTAERIAAYGCTPVLRKSGSDPFISDNGNYILDCLFQTIAQPEQLHQQMKQLVGVVETGLFLHMTDRLLVARNGIVDVITNHTID